MENKIPWFETTNRVAIDLLTNRVIRFPLSPLTFLGLSVLWDPREASRIINILYPAW